MGWKRHKALCAAIKTARPTIRDVTAAMPKDKASWTRYVNISLANIRPLCKIFDSDTIMFQRHCQVCFHTPFMSATTSRADGGDELVACKRCCMVSHCPSPACESAFHHVHTAEACERYLVGYTALFMSVEQGDVLVDVPHRDDELISKPKYQSSQDHFPLAWASYFAARLPKFQFHFLSHLPPVTAMMTDGLSIPMTVLSGLIRAYSWDVVMGMNKIQVHVIGAAGFEMLGAKKYEEIIHWLPNCKDLTIAFVGPALNRLDPDSLEEAESYPTCTFCDAKGVSIKYLNLPGTYHDVITAGGINVSDGTIAIACHSGIHDHTGMAGSPESVGLAPSLQQLWTPTLDLLIASSDLPVIFTSYNANEASEDVAILRGRGAHVIQEPIQNPFRGLLPFKEVYEDNKFYFSNNYWCLVRGPSGR
jgi:hypothetical protein